MHISSPKKNPGSAPVTVLIVEALIFVCFLSMKTIDISESGKALLVRENGQYFAVGHKCTHYGAPLNTGHLSNGRVRCPWHGACFNIRTGDIEDFPGLDSIPKFEVMTIRYIF